MYIGIYESVESLARLMVEALANGIWQGVALALLGALVFRFVPRLSARARYSLVGVTLFVALSLPVLSAHTAFLGAVNKSQGASMEGFVQSPQTGSGEAEVMRSEASPDVTLHESHCPAVAAGVDETSMPRSIAVSDVTPQLSRGHASDEPELLLTGSVQLSGLARPEVTEAKSPLIPAFAIPGWTAPLSDKALWIVFAVWVVIAMAFIVRLALSYAHLQKLKRRATPLEAILGRRLQRHAENVGVRRPVRFAESSEVTMPLAIGLGATAVIYPAHLLEALDDEEIDQIALHEIAHLQRYDDWACLAQQIAQALFFFNPAILWLCRRFELEREMACDEFVIHQGAKARNYAACLTRLVELTRPASRAPLTANTSLAAGAFINRSRLSVRVERILNQRLGLSRRSSAAVVAGVSLSILAVAAQFVATPRVVAFEEPEVELKRLAPATPAKVVTLPAASATSALSHAFSISGYPSPSPVVTLASADESDDHARKRRSRRIAKLRDQLRELSSQLRDTSITISDDQRDEIRKELRKLRDRVRKLTRRSRNNQVVVAPAPDYRSGGDDDEIGYRSFPSGTVMLNPGRGESIVFSEDGTTATVAPLPGVGSGSRSVITYKNIGDDPSYQSVTLGENGYAYIYGNDGEDDDPVYITGGSTVSGIGSFNGVFDFGDGEVSYSWRDGGRRITVRSRGDVQFTADDTDIESISDEGFIVIRERRRGVDREYEVYAYEDGALERTYYEDGRRREIDDDAREWISEVILRAIRNTGIGAQARIERFLQAGGVDAALAEIQEIESSHSQKLYYDALLSSGESFTSAEYVEILNRLSRDVDSDYERAELLSGIDRDVLRDPEVTSAYVNAIDYIDSDFEKRRALTPILRLRDLPAKTTVQLLRVAENFDSDFERAELLSAISDRGLTDTAVQRAYVRAVMDIDSDFEKRRVLSNITDVDRLERSTLLTALEIAETIGSDFERSELLIDLYPQASEDNQLLSAYVTAIEDISSNFEKRRALDALTDRRILTPEITLSVLNMAQTISSDYERAELLLDMSRYCTNDERLWESYVEAVGDLSSDYETSRVLQKIAFDEPDEKTLLSTLDIVRDMSSDFEKAKILRDLMDVCLDNENLREAYLDVIDSLDSDYERNKLIDRIYKKDRREKRRGR